MPHREDPIYSSRHIKAMWYDHLNNTHRGDIQDYLVTLKPSPTQYYDTPNELSSSLIMIEFQ